MTPLLIVVNVVLFALSFLSGMLGLGVAFVAIPALGLFGFELKHVIMPWALWLNGLTAISAAVTYMRKKMVDYRTAIPLVLITTALAPAGVWLLRFAETRTVWWVFVAVLVFLAARMVTGNHAQTGPDVTNIPHTKRAVACGIGGLIGIFAGFLGVGPGFLLMPTLVLVGYTARIAAATNSLAVTLPSFSAFAAHWTEAHFDLWLMATTSVTATLGAQLGALFMAKRVKSVVLKRTFAALLVGLALQRAVALLR